MSYFATARIVFLGLLALTSASCSDDDSGDDGGAAAGCAVSSDDCIAGCIEPQCGASISACSADAMCDMAKDTMVDCVCDAQDSDDASAVAVCFRTFDETGGALAGPFSSCAATNCATACDL